MTSAHDERAARMADLKAMMDDHRRLADVAEEAALALPVKAALRLAPGLAGLTAYHLRLAGMAADELAELSR